MNRLFDKIYGFEAAVTIANSMGDPTEGMSYQKIEEKYGFVDQLLPQDKKSFTRQADHGPAMVFHAHYRPPGMSEDGLERHRLCTSAIIKKGGRIDINDLARTYIEDIDPAKFGYTLGPQDQVIYYGLQAGIPPWEIGKFAVRPTYIGTSKLVMPVGAVNACNPEQAAQDAFELGRIKDTRGVPGNYALEVCAGITAAVAEALKPTATIDSIIDTALAYLSEAPRKEVEMGLHWAKNVSNWKELRPLYAEKYKGLSGSVAVEILSGALACFWIADGRPRESILYAVNFGRDTDCKASVAGGLAGALRGIGEVPPEWVRIVEEQVVTDPYTVSRRTAREAAEGLYQAAISTLSKMKAVTGDIEEMIERG